MHDRFVPRPDNLPASLREKTRWVHLPAAGAPGGIPALLAHPDWSTPAPTVIWLHGRTVNKELDSGRYLRWIRAGIAACAIDLPGHGERFEERFHAPSATLELLDAAVREIDHVVEALADPAFSGVFDLERFALGGMSAGGMATLRRLCDDHPFTCAAVEGATGNLNSLFSGRNPRPWPADHRSDEIDRLDPARHLDTWRPIPLLALHAEQDEVVPWPSQRDFLDELRRHYRLHSSPESLIRFRTWSQTGAPQEHSGFGRFGNDAKNLQTEFFVRHLRPALPGTSAG